MRKAVLVVSFGTSFQEARAQTLDRIEMDVRQAFAGYGFRRSYTSPTIRRILKDRDGLQVDDVAQALEGLLADGYRKVAVQPTFVVGGKEYDRMVEMLFQYKGRFERLSWGTPLLEEAQDYRETLQAMEQELGAYRDAGTAVILLGHGTEHAANASYVRLQQTCDELGMEDFMVGTVEDSPLQEQLQRRLLAYGPKRVLLVPFLVAAGNHACRDIASDREGSWKSRMRNAGYETECLMKGLGQYSGIRQIYVRHGKLAAKEL